MRDGGRGGNGAVVGRGVSLAKRGASMMDSRTGRVESKSCTNHKTRLLACASEASTMALPSLRLTGT